MAAHNLILRCGLPPGDLCTLTAAIESLHALYPGRFLTAVRSNHPAIFLNNPHVHELSDSESDAFEMHYTELVQRSDGWPNPFLRGYCQYLGRVLELPLELVTNRPHLYLNHAERAFPDDFGELQERFWLINAGIKRDFTLKQWPVEFYQNVVDHFRGRIRFVQVGSSEDDHPKLSNVISLVGKTDLRQLIRVVYHAQGGIGPITLLQHLCAAFEKPYVAILGGREPVNWVQYPLQTTLHTLGQLPCCRTKACWRSRVVPLNDGCEQDRSLCELPVLDLKRPVGKCMSIIQPAEVIRALEHCFEGGVFEYA